MKCLILAAGYATRLYPLTENFPKPLLDVKGKPILEWLIDDIESSGAIEEYIVISNHKFIMHFEDWKNGYAYKDKITIIDDGTTTNEWRLGAVTDIELAIEKLSLDDDLMVIAGDNLLDFSLRSFIEYFHKKNGSCIIRYYEEDLNKIKKSASVSFTEDDLVLSMIEKPENPESNYCVPPFYIYAKHDVPLIKTALDNGCNKDAPGSLINYLFDKTNIYAMEMPGKRYDIGNLESYKYVCDKFGDTF